MAPLKTISIVIALATIVFAILFLAKRVSAQERIINFKEAEKVAGTLISVRPYENAPFRDGGKHSNTVVLIPSEIKKVETVIVYLHGFNTDVSDGAFVSMLSDGFEQAPPEAILIAPQLAFMRESGDSGYLQSKNTLESLIKEVLSSHHLQAKDPETIIISYSGGYRAAIDCLENNPQLNISSVVFLDTLYWRAEDVLDWAEGKERKVLIFSSNEKVSLAAKKYFVAVATYFFNSPPPELSEEEFFSTRFSSQFMIINTTKKHKEIPKLFGPILKKVKGE